MARTHSSRSSKSGRPRKTRLTFKDEELREAQEDAAALRLRIGVSIALVVSTLLIFGVFWVTRPITPLEEMVRGSLGRIADRDSKNDSPREAAERAPAPKEGYGYLGRWNTTFGELTLYERDDHRVTGRYTGAGGGFIDGTVELDGILEFHWSEEGGGRTGRGWFSPINKGTSINGAWGYGLSKSDGGAWTGERLPETFAAGRGVDHALFTLGFEGEWKTNFGDVDLEEDGLTVEGRYVYERGETIIHGRLIGWRESGILYFDWYEETTSGRGAFWLTKQDAFEGRWGKGTDRSNGGTWEGER